MRQLTEIKTLRKKYGLNQKELATTAGVSQSLIAKIEAGKVEPTFRKAQQIFAALDQLREKTETKASDIMNTKVIFVDAHESVKKVVELMKKKGISQIPVKDGEKICGTITEGTILKTMMEKPTSIQTLPVEDVMDDAPPIVSPKTGIEMLTRLLRDYSIVLVAQKGVVKGIISKSDLLGEV